MMALRLLVSPGLENSRHARWMSPVPGSTAMVVPWFFATPSLSFDGVDHVTPQSFDFENRIFERTLLSPPTNDV